jgi:hypothetical protein
MNRLPLPYGLLINRQQPVEFEFDHSRFKVLQVTVLPVRSLPTNAGLCHAHLNTIVRVHR